MSNKKFDYEIIEKIGVISTTKTTSKEINLIKWGQNSAKYDIRVWGDKFTAKGITFTLEEMKILKELINKIKF